MPKNIFFCAFFLKLYHLYIYILLRSKHISSKDFGPKVTKKRYLAKQVERRQRFSIFCTISSFLNASENRNTVYESALFDREKGQIARYVSKNLTARTKQIITDLSLNISRQTVYRFLHEIHEYTPMKAKPLLTQNHIVAFTMEKWSVSRFKH